ncbi:MAG: 30S ribosome-binding factor RbfA [Planctomycetes bacterium]|nr:30S ribosome-binding factor RbfA [Planctomycetota bacterium]MBU4398603.1 30S ribosome-binding factor RbfA [Planctomycetota bacterium]MCG2683671.1 30S ribosome-binding factor RbfA [Planctomycetales bacterium]
MSSRRLEKAAAAIREVVSMAILSELKDPRVRDVTVTFVEVSPDLRHAKVHVSVMGDEGRQKLTLCGLQSAAGFLQAKIAERIDIRYTPRLSFLLDQGVKRSIAVARILQEVLPKEEPAETGMESPSAAEDSPPAADQDLNEPTP